MLIVVIDVLMNLVSNINYINFRGLPIPQILQFLTKCVSYIKILTKIIIKISNQLPICNYRYNMITEEVLIMKMFQKLINEYRVLN